MTARTASQDGETVVVVHEGDVPGLLDGPELDVLRAVIEDQRAGLVTVEGVDEVVALAIPSRRGAPAALSPSLRSVRGAGVSPGDPFVVDLGAALLPIQLPVDREDVQAVTHGAVRRVEVAPARGAMP